MGRFHSYGYKYTDTDVVEIKKVEINSAWFICTDMNTATDPDKDTFILIRPCSNLCFTIQVNGWACPSLICVTSYASSHHSFLPVEKQVASSHALHQQIHEGQNRADHSTGPRKCCSLRPQSSRWLSLSLVCWVCLCCHNPPNSDRDYRIFILCTDVNACDCTWGCTDTVRESALKVNSRRKFPCCTGELNLPQQCASPTFYQLSYLPTNNNRTGFQDTWHLNNNNNNNRHL